MFDFPGTSVEKMIDTFCEDFPFDRTTIFVVELQRPSLTWIFNLDMADPDNFYPPPPKTKPPTYDLLSLSDDFNAYWKYKNNQPTRDYYSQTF